MSCAELMYHSNLSAGFSFHRQPSSRFSDVYFSNYNSAAASHYNATQAGAADSRMLQPLVGEASSGPSAVSSDFPSSPSLSLGPSASPQEHLSGSRDSRLTHALPLSPSCAQPPPAANIAGTATPSSSPLASSPLLASSSTLSPSLSFFAPSTSAFTARAAAQSYNGVFPSEHPPSFLNSPPHTALTSSYSSVLKRSSSDLDDPDDATVPKKTRYLASNCVVLTYHEKETSSEVDDHFSKALSSPASCSYGSGGNSRHSSTGSPPMSQRNFPPSFWDAHYQYHYPYHYQAFAGSSSSQGGFLGSPHDALYPLSSPFLPGTLGTSTLHHPLSSLHKDTWAGFPFTSGSKSTLNYYSYPRAVTYADPHALSATYGSVATGANSSRLSSNYGSLLLPSSSVRTGHFPSATITSAQCSSGELGTRMNSLVGEHPRSPFASGSLAGPDSTVQTSGKDLHWF